MVSETKIDEMFPKEIFFIEWFSTSCRLDRDSKGRGIMLNVKNDVPLMLLKINPLKIFFIELNSLVSKYICNRDKIEVKK